MNIPFYARLMVQMFVRSVGIETVSVAVTNRCNSRCETCGIWRQGQQDELAPSYVFNLLAARCVKKPVHVDLTGGEPFLASKLADLVISLAEDQRVAGIGITTNGSLPDRVFALADDLARRGLRHRLGIGVSVDGQAEIHDRIRGVPGSCERAWATLSGLRDRGWQPQISFTISKHNVGQAAGLLQRWRTAGYPVSYRMAQANAPLFAQHHSDSSFQPSELRQLQELLLSPTFSEPPSGRWWHRMLSAHWQYNVKMLRSQGRPRWYRCFSGLHSIFVDTRGTVFPCTILASPLGDLGKESLDAIMSSGQARRVLRSIAARRCACWTNCETIPSLSRIPTVSLINVVRWLKTMCRPGSH